MRFIIDGKEVAGEPARPGHAGEIDAIVLKPDDITLSLSRRMKKSASLSIDVPFSRGEKTMEFSLDGYGTALIQVEPSGD